MAKLMDNMINADQPTAAGHSHKSLPVGTAYAVWVGIGPVGKVQPGIALLDEPANPARLIGVALIIAGIIGLKLAS